MMIVKIVHFFSKKPKPFTVRIKKRKILKKKMKEEKKKWVDIRG